MTTKNGSSLNLRLDEAAGTLCFDILNDNQIVAGVQFPAEQLDEIIGGLGHLRSQMAPPVPEQLPVGKPTHRTNATHYHAGVDPQSGQLMLSLRNPGLGWLSFSMTIEHIEEVARQGREVRARLATPLPDSVKTSLPDSIK